MKKSKILIAAGTLILATAAVFATKANKKFTTGLATAAINVTGSEYYHVKLPTDLFTTADTGKGLWLNINKTQISETFLTATNEAVPLFYK